MKKTVEREILVCDFCETEAVGISVQTCVFCGKDFCGKCGILTSMIGKHVCNDCKGKSAPYSERIQKITTEYENKIAEMEEEEYKKISEIDKEFEEFIKAEKE